jgi:hypothetical protein
MPKIVVALLLTTLAACGYYALGADAGADVNWHSVLAEAKDREAELQASGEQRRLLTEAMDRVLARYEQGSIDLAQAAQAIETEAAAIYPDFLYFLELMEAGATLHEKLGYNVVRHFHARHRQLKTSEAAHVLERCEAELRAMLGHELVEMNLVH